MKISISNIQLPAQVRFDWGNLQEMKVSLQTHGLLHPILVRPLSESSYELVAGYRRLQAAESLGWTDIPVTVLTPKDTLEQFDLSMEENMQRKDFNVLEICELLLQRKRFWEQKYGPIINGQPTTHGELSTNAESFYEEAGRIFKKCKSDIYAFLQLQGLDEDLKTKVETGEIHYRKALAQQSARKPPSESKGRKTRKRGVRIPEPATDVLALQHDIQKVIWVMGELYQALRLVENQPYDLTPLADDHLVELVSVVTSLIQWLSLLNAKLQGTLMQKMELQVENQ